VFKNKSRTLPQNIKKISSKALFTVFEPAINYFYSFKMRDKNPADKSAKYLVRN